jgi:signal transduction histidine kinase
MLNRVNTKTGIALALLCFLSALFLNYLNSSSTEGLRNKAEKLLHKKEERALEQLDLMAKMLEKNTPAQLFNLYEGNITRLYDEEKIALFIFESDSLRFWSTNQVPFHDNSLTFIEEENGIRHLRNGWYEFFYKKAGKYDALSLILIKPDYDVQNNYLNNSFAEWLQLPASARLKYPVANKEAEVRSLSEKPLFSIETYESSVYGKGLSYVSVILFFMAFFMFLIFGLRDFLKKEISFLKFAIISAGVLAVRAFMIWLKWPSLLYQNELFDAATYGNTDSFFNELLGDIFLNVLLFFAWTFVFYKKVRIKLSSPFNQVLILCVFAIGLTLLSLQLNHTIESFVSNSTISFEFSNFFNLNSLSFLCLGIILINGFSVALLIEKFIQLLKELALRPRNLFLISLLIVYTALFFLFGKSYFTIYEWFWFLIFLGASVVLEAYTSRRSIISIGTRLMLFSVIVSFLFSYYNSQNEEKNLKFLSDQLLDKQDPIVENTFSEVVEEIENDGQLMKALKSLPLFASQTEQHIRQNYFTGYFEKYNIQLALFDSLCMPYFKNSDLTLSNNEFFEDQIAKSMPIRENLFFIKEYEANSLYVGKIDFETSLGRKPLYTLYVLLSPKQFADEGSFPDLLLDKSQQKQTKYKQFSYAIYKNGKLSANYGDFDEYPIYYGAKPSLISSHHGFSHHVYEGESGSFVILSTKVKDFKYYFTVNSYYFLFFSLLGLLLAFGYAIANNKVRSFFSLSRRIQLFIVSILFFALVAVGIFSIQLVSKKFEEDNVNQLSDKARRLYKELNPLLFNTQNLEVNSRLYAESILKKYAILFNSDISLYNEKGFLFASSQPSLFETGLSSRLINPSAVNNFKRNASSYFNTKENIGSLNYISLYTGIYSPSGKFLGYINLPYFARQNHLEEQLSDYVSTLLNIYVVLFLVSLLTGLIVTAYITKPLRIIQAQLAGISLGAKNEPISWQSNDEIGKLVNEYNHMLVKLEESAGLLARSEREGAWREMAKQVAHEIKNPLTPMKLNLQYLQKIASEEPESFSQKFKSVSASIIEQIDTLAYIANEFSNFAKLPKGNQDRVNLLEVIHSTIELFRTSGNIQFHVDSFSDEVIVIGDKNQCLRIFNNLIKNAVQSIPVDRQGNIRVRITAEEDNYLITVEDNGCGISEAMREKIFVPNFTTKSTGTGLGLAMVKNIISAMGGSIWFESTQDIGTVFYIRLRKPNIIKG